MRDELRHEGKQWGYVAATAALAVPAFLIEFGGLHFSVELETILFGLGILGAAFLLSWAAEVAQMDISQGMAIAFLAFIAVLPEYAVDFVIAWGAGSQDAAVAGRDACAVLPAGQTCDRELAIANMTGANRLLIGLGWATVVLVWWLRSKRRGVELEDSRRTDLGFMFIATLWAVTIIIRGWANVLDTVVLVGLFGLYLWHVAQEEQEHPDLIGPPLTISRLGVAGRRAVTIGLFVYSAAAILASAHPFAEGLKAIGEEHGISQFLLIQWIAPLASEAPEMIIAVLFVLRAKPQQGLGALVSSKVNQWTLLVGTLPLVYAMSFGSLTHPMALSAQQVEEVLLTAAQSLFAVAVLANLTISRGEAALLLVLFLAQFGFPSSAVRYGFSAAYFLGFLVIVITDKAGRRGLISATKLAVTRPRRAPAKH